VIELPYANSHKDTVMVIFVNTSIAFVTVSHPNPLIQATNLTSSFLFEHSFYFDMTVQLITVRFTFQDHEMKNWCDYHYEKLMRMIPGE